MAATTGTTPTNVMTRPIESESEEGNQLSSGLTGGDDTAADTDDVVVDVDVDVSGVSVYDMSAAGRSAAIEECVRTKGISSSGFISMMSRAVRNNGERIDFGLRCQCSHFTLTGKKNGYEYRTGTKGSGMKKFKTLDNRDATANPITRQFNHRVAD